ncbi:MAG TPA: archaeal proteasome endopeptidase complex subunit alpha [Candidatus Nanoarchaeia archaeon]|nr:archaeal proteasome endopeptidase complex subunit alpha [Candidatus Nanoarchaeia archaeon]
MEMPIDMQHQAMGYDRSATMFSPEGTILQVEYAEKAVRHGSSSIGIVCVDGIMILADKRIDDKLLIQKSASKIYEVDSHAMASVAGIISDARVLIERAQLLSQQHRVTYDSPIEPELIIKEVSNVKQQFSQWGGARPFGASLMVGGINGKRAELFTSDVTGNYFNFYANAIGENDEKIKEKLRERFRPDLTLKKATKIALEIFEEIKEKKFDITKFELAYIKNDELKLVRLDGEEIRNFSKA